LQAEVDYARSAMAEWLILVLLVPAIVVPVVALVGFAGCSFEHGALAFAPIIESAVGESLSAIILTWHLDPNDPDASAAHTFEIERTRPNSQMPDDPVPVLASPFEDTGVPTSNADPVAGTIEVYTYRVRRVRTSDGDQSGWSSPASTPTFFVSFGGPNFLAAGMSPPAPAGFCLIQRIETSQLTFSGTKIQIILHGASTSSLSIDRIYISQPGGTKPYDPGSDLTKIYDIDDPSTPMPFVLDVDKVKSLPIIGYSLDHNQSLLIAFDLSPGAAGQVRFIDLPPPPPGQQPAVTAYESPVAAAEAASPTRSANYISVPNRLFSIEVIGVGG
jgi:hypothetical protein